jgi:hypothetical protein
VFENRVLGGIFGPNRDETAESWRKLHNEELQKLYSSLYMVRIIKSRRMRRAVLVARMGEMRNKCSILVIKPEGKRPLGKPREMGFGGVNWIHLAQDKDRWRALVNTVLILRVVQKKENFSAR